MSKLADHNLVGLTITGVNVDKEGFVLFHLSDGGFFYAASDDGENEPGCLFSVKPVGTEKTQRFLHQDGKVDGLGLAEFNPDLTYEEAEAAGLAARMGQI